MLGLQGRYFIPLTFQTVYLLKKKYGRAETGKEGTAHPDIMTAPAVCMCAANLIVLVTLFVFYV